MSIREMRTYAIECDGYLTNGKKCNSLHMLSAPTTYAVEQRAKDYGWHEDSRGWLCGSEHRRDMP